MTQPCCESHMAAQDVMPMPGSKLSAFLDAVRRDAEDALDSAFSGVLESSESSSSTCLGGAVLRWKDGPEIVEVKKLVGGFRNVFPFSEREHSELPGMMVPTGAK